MRRNVARGVAIALELVTLLGGATSEAQVTGGTIVGSVKDQQGAAVPGATVTITEVNKGNTPQFGFPNAAIGSPTAGRITTTIADNRSMQFALKLDF